MWLQKDKEAPTDPREELNQYLDDQVMIYCFGGECGILFYFFQAEY